MNGKSYFWIVMKNPKNDPKEPLLFFVTNLENAK